jgi:hypothetical protein
MTFLGTLSTSRGPLRWRRIAGLLREPVPREARARLDAIWAGLDPRFRTANQMFGHHEEGCGATIGVMPRCDFACRGCYLGGDANRTPALTVAAVTAQLNALRAHLGPGGNVQLTDGEVTLRDADEVIAIVRHARAIGLVPMLMTHGDAFLRDAALLARLMVEGGLEEISLHIDTTQRGRRDLAVRHAGTEAELMALHARIAAADFAALARDEKLALLINLYNAATLRLVLDHWPLASIRDIPAKARWKARRWSLAGRTVSLDEIENDELRAKFAEPRIHFAINCAAAGCPRLRNRAFAGADIGAALEAHTCAVHADPRWCRVADTTLHLTRIYRWYDGDFAQAAGSVRAFAGWYAPTDTPPRRLRWLPYDWALNAA